MATRNVKIDIELSTKNQKKVLKDVKDIHDQVKATQQAASSGIGLAAAAKPGTAASGGARIGAAAAASGAVGTQVTGTDYRMARGLSEATGASARDFARQSQGLGGLVRLYATYAANVFAVTAAFQSLSQAMNTENMIRGLNQLGAASGQALGNLAKEFTQAAGGAISLRESMEATTKAISSGLNEQQFLQLGEVALKASQALGINMSDAVSRLTRGITKLEPELLDELGIFTKLDKAVEDYSRQVGKSAGSLTDFERRQAFANAVLTEGIQKFGEIQIDTNPYDKLLATLKDVSQTVLTLVNTAIAPLVNLLASSPVALAGILGGLGINLLRNVIPALSQFRESIKTTAAEAKSISEQRAGAATAALTARRTKIAAENKQRSDALADAAVETLIAAEKKFEQATKGRLKAAARKQVDEVKNILKTMDVESISQQQIDRIRGFGSKLKDQNNIYTQLANSLDKVKTTHQEYNRVVTQGQKLIDAEPPKWSAAGRAQADARRAAQRDTRLRLTSLAAETTATDGARIAWRELNKNIKEEGLSKGQAALTRMGGGAAIAATRLASFAGAAGAVGMGILSAVAIFETFNALLGKNDKEVEIFKSSIDKLEESIKTANDTTKKFKDELSEQSIIAISTAFIGVTNEISSLTKALEDADRKANWFDRFIDGAKRFIGLDLRTQFAKNFSFALLQAVETIDDPNLKSKLESQLKELFGRKPGQQLTAANIEDILQQGAGDSKALFETVKSAEKLLDSTRTAYDRQRQSIKQLQDANKDLEKTFKDLSNTFINTDPGTKFALSAITQLQALISVLGETRTETIGLKNAVNSLSISAFLPESAKAELLELQKEYDNIQKQIKAANTVAKQTIQSIGENTAVDFDQSFASAMVPSTTETTARSMTVQVKEQVTELDRLQTKLKKVNSEISLLTENYNDATLQLEDQKSILHQAGLDIVQYNNQIEDATSLQAKLKAELSSLVDVWGQAGGQAVKNVNDLGDQLRYLGGAGPRAIELKDQLVELQKTISDLTANRDIEIAKVKLSGATVTELQNALDRIQASGTDLVNVRAQLELDISKEGSKLKSISRSLGVSVKNVLDEKDLEKLRNRMAEIIKEAERKAREAIGKALETITAPLRKAISETTIEAQKTLLQLLPAQSTESIKLSLDLEKQSIDLRRQELQRLSDLTKAVELNRLALEISDAKADIRAEASVGSDQSIVDKLYDRLGELEQERNIILNPKLLTNALQSSKAAGLTPEQRREALGEIKVDGKPLAAGSIQQFTRLIGEATQQEQLNRQQQVAEIKARYDIARAGVQEQIDSEQKLLQNRKTENALYLQSVEFRQLSTTEQEATRRSLELSVQAQQNYIEGLKSSKDIAGLQTAEIEAQNRGYKELAGEINRQRINLEGIARTSADARNTELQASQDALVRKATQDSILETLREQKLVSAAQFKDDELATKTTLELLSLEQAQLNNQRSANNITQTQFEALNNIIERRKILLEGYQQELSVKQEIAQAELSIQERLAGVEPGGADAQRIAQEGERELNNLRNRLGAIQLMTQARLKDLDTQKLQTERQKAYESAFMSAFDNMADAIVNFALTGEKSFKDLFRNLVADLARFELRLQTSALWSAIRVPLMQGLGFNINPLPGLYAPSGMGEAKGGAYNMGVRERFAKGGTFTNQIVDSPTLFKFARGTGLMGEAGPEAIMPLKRDSQGNLGVRASNQSAPRVEVIVNNNSQTPATAKETVDSRGNRRIEVTVGDMVSGEMVRPGSSVRETMQANYGLRPALVRR